MMFSALMDAAKSAAAAEAEGKAKEENADDEKKDGNENGEADGSTETKEISPAVKRFRMLSRLTQIVGGPEGGPLPKNVRALPSLKKQTPKPAEKSMWNPKSSKMKKLKLICKMNSVVGLIAPQKKKGKPEKKKVHWRKYGKKDPAPPKVTKPLFDIKKLPPRERIYEIRLTASSEYRRNAVRYDVTKQEYLSEDQDLTVDLLTIEPLSMRRREPVQKPRVVEPTEEVDMYTQSSVLALSGDDEDEEEVEEDAFCGVISKEELARIDSQANPFNFSERVSQTAHFSRKHIAIQTEPSITRNFCCNVGFSIIYDAYKTDFALKQQKEKEEGDDKEKEEKDDVLASAKSSSGSKKHAYDSSRAPRDIPQICDLPGIPKTSRIVERMITQNLYDDISQDFKYFEDGGDEFHPMEGSLLPLWKFYHENSRTMVVSDISWSPVYPDLFAAAYTAGDVTGSDSPGMLCLYTLKNPACPERTLRSPCSVMCVGFHPTRGNMLAAGWSDGTIVVYNVESSEDVRAISSTTMNGKHILPVCKLKWIHTDPGEHLQLFSVAQDGRLTQWLFGDSRLRSKDIFSFSSDSKGEKNSLEGTGTCIDFRPDNETELLVGIDTGLVIQCSVSCSSHTFIRYPAHSAPVRGVGWNRFYCKVFISCSVDWSVKVWLQEYKTPLITLDMGGAVAAISWSTFSSSVFVAVTEEGRILVYDLHVRQSKPLCVQSVVKKRPVVVTSLSFNTYYPVILVGGERGHLVTLKLSPNLRQVNKDPRDLEEMSHKEVEICKMERLIAVNKG